MVAVEDTLVILRRPERHHALAVAQHEVRQLCALEALLDHDPRAGVAEAPLAHHRRHGGVGRRRVSRHHHALAGGEAIGLQHDGIAEPLRGEHRDRFVGRLARVIGSRRHPMTGHEGLRKGLARFECRRRARRPENRQAQAREVVDDAAAEGELRTNNREVDAKPRRESGRGGGVGRVERLGSGDANHPRVARGTGDRIGAHLAREPPGEGVFTPAGTKDERGRPRTHGGQCSSEFGIRSAERIRRISELAMKRGWRGRAMSS